MHTLSFTGERQLRYPAPDVARGAMLALIALANVPFWIAYFPETPQAGHAVLEAMNGADQWWYLARTVLVDRRAYPLFSILFGFGMAIMASRTMERERRAAVDTFSAEEVARWHPVQRQIVEENIERHVRRVAARLIRRRGLWMLVFGGVHALFFSGDIIGTYGLVAVCFAEVVVMKRAWPRVLVGSLVAALSLLGLWGAGFSMGGTPMVLEYHGPMALTMFYPLTSLGTWLGATIGTVLMSLVVPCVMIGVGLARWGVLQDPRGHRLVLACVAVGGLGVGVLGGLPFALMQLDWAFAGSAAWSYPLFHASGVAGACGWLALLALVGGGPREKLGAACAFLSAIGRRSMTAYLSQTLLFILICGAAISFGVRSLGVAVSGLIALVVWALIGLGCAIAEAMGSSRGPAEWALRWLVAKSAKKRPMPAFVPVPVVRSDVSTGVAQASSFPVAPVPAPGVEPNGRAQGGTSDSE
ncbi:PF04235 family protein [Actinomyces sp. ICM54]|uniref:DUF418 domain-containing protein n=1 Tax=Actinomyces sp. ICM54 TaxID=936549 RepID=UPI000445492E|nr:DUF418 domain-containing protein [Actinomyces sp. ICM54]EWC99460.1 PF04235 family protein [Actinomyces sp. ICM54]